MNAIGYLMAAFLALLLLPLLPLIALIVGCLYVVERLRSGSEPST
jgi:flagellar biogenesis protein FliO